MIVYCYCQNCLTVTQITQLIEGRIDSVFAALAFLDARQINNNQLDHFVVITVDSTSTKFVVQIVNKFAERSSCITTQSSW